MPIADRLIHSLTIVTPSTTGGVDEYGQPVAGDPTTVDVAGLIQPKTAREIALVSQAGAQVSDHTVFLQPQTLSNAAYIRYATDDGDRYEIVGIRYFNFGQDPHLEVDCRRVRSEALLVDSGVGS